MTIFVKHTGIAIEYGGRANFPGYGYQSNPGKTHHLCNFIGSVILLYVLEKPFFLKNSKKLFLLEMFC